MHIEAIREYCLQKKGVSEELPFDEHTLVYKVKGKIFLIAALESKPLVISLKCEPEKAIQLREQYSSIQAGYHLNKKHWNSITLNGSLNSPQLEKWIDDSYNLVVQKLPKKTQQELFRDE